MHNAPFCLLTSAAHNNICYVLSVLIFNNKQYSIPNIQYIGILKPQTKPKGMRAGALIFTIDRQPQVKPL